LDHLVCCQYLIRTNLVIILYSYFCCKLTVCNVQPYRFVIPLTLMRVQYGCTRLSSTSVLIRNALSTFVVPIDIDTGTSSPRVTAIRCFNIDCQDIVICSAYMPWNNSSDNHLIEFILVLGCLYRQERRQGFRPGWANAPKKFFSFAHAHPGFQFAHPAIHNGCPACPPYRVTMAVSVAVCEIFSIIECQKWPNLENRVRVRSRSLEMAPMIDRI